MTITSTDKYRVVGEVGSGGMGIVYHAVQTRLDRHVAIKVLKPRYARDPSFVQRFRQEARALAALPHTHIVQIYDVERVGDDLWIIMEWVDGRTLRDVMKTDGPLSWERAVLLIRQCAAALAAGHEAGILHRDVKPENILLTPDDTVKVMDFGVALFLDPDRNVTTETGAGIGSPRYMSPEQLAGEPADARADQFALALVAFELCTGAFPYPGADIYSIGHEKLHSEALHLRQYWAEAPAHLDEGLARALRREPSNRFGNLHEFMEAIDPPPPRKLPLTPFALGAFVMLCLLLGGFYFLRPPDPPPQVIVQVVPPAPAAVPEPALPPPAPEPAPEPEPDPVVPLVAALDTALLAEQYDEAAQLVEEIFSHEPEHPHAQSARQQIQLARAQEQLFADAVALYERGVLEEAKGMFRGVLTTRPNHPEAQQYVARIERRQRLAALLAAARNARAEREVANAKQAYRDVLALEPTHAEAQRVLREIAAEEARAAKVAAAEQAVAAGDLAMARTQYEAILADTPDDPDAGRGLARIAAVERARARFDAPAFAAELGAHLQGFEEAIAAVEAALLEHERTAEDQAARQAARAGRVALRTYGRQIQAPLRELARGVDAAGAEMQAFPARIEKTTGRYFELALDNQHNQRDRLVRGTSAMIATLESDGAALAGAAPRRAARVRGRLLGGEDTQPINRAILVYRRPGSFLGRGRQPIDPVGELAAELAPLRTALEELATETRQAAGTQPVGIAAVLVGRVAQMREDGDAVMAERLQKLNAAQQLRSEEDRAAEGRLVAALEEALAAFTARAHTAREGHETVLGIWSAAITEEAKRHERHFADADRRMTAIAAQLTQDVSKLSARISRQLAEQRRASTAQLASAPSEREWLAGRTAAITAAGPAQFVDVATGVAEALPARGEDRAAEYTAVRTQFARVTEDGHDRMALYQRARATTLKRRVAEVRRQVRDTADRVDTWDEAQVRTLRAGAARLRDVGDDVDAAVERWADEVARARAEFGKRSRTAFGEVERVIQRATTEIGAVQPALARLADQLARGSGAPAEGLLAEADARVDGVAEYVGTVAAGIDAYNANLQSAATAALARRATATTTLVAALSEAGTALAAVGETFDADARARAGDFAGASAALVAACDATLVQFETRARELAPPDENADVTTAG